MFEVLAIVAVCGLLGWQFTTRSTSGQLLAAPVMGLSVIVFLAYALSMNFGVTGADAVVAATGILIITFIARQCYGWKKREKRYPYFKKDIQSAVFALLPAVILLIPAMLYGIQNYFGVINFDFFYNSQDAWFLSENTVKDFRITGGGGIEGGDIFPFDWSAEPQGRFAIALFGAFAFKFLGVNPLHFHSSVFSALVVISALTAYLFAQRVLCLPDLFCGLATGVFILSAGFSQSYIYYLLGQISAIPVFVFVCLVSCQLLQKMEIGEFRIKNIWYEALILGILLNTLFVLYLILFCFALAVIILSIFLVNIKNRTFSIKKVWRSLLMLVCVPVFFVLTRLFAFSETKQMLFDWIALSTKVSKQNSHQFIVFGEYITESFLSLFLGIFTYPTNASYFNGILGFGTSRSWIIFFIGILAFLVFLNGMIIILMERNIPDSGKAIIFSIFLTAFFSGFFFFSLGAAYAVFKISSWFIPIILMISVAAIFYLLWKNWRWKKVSLFALFSLISANGISAINYSYSPLLSKHSRNQNAERFVNVNGINGFPGIRALKDWLKTHPDELLILNLMDGLRLAWFANEFRERQSFPLSHNTQILQDRIWPDMPCSSSPPLFLSTEGILISDQVKQNSLDIISIPAEYTPAFHNETYSAYRITDLPHFAFLGRGSYPPTSLSTEEIQQTGFPSPFRWVEKGLEIYIFSRNKTILDMELDVMPGYVSGPSVRTIRLTGSEYRRTASFQKKAGHVYFNAIPVSQGLNCFYLQSNDEVVSQLRYGALFRAEVSTDPRFLNFVVGNMQFNFKK